MEHGTGHLLALRQLFLPLVACISSNQTNVTTSLLLVVKSIKDLAHIFEAIFFFIKLFSMQFGLLSPCKQIFFLGH